MREAELRTFKDQLAGLVGLPIDEFAHKASVIHPEIASALDGFYCGRSGEIREPVFGDRLLCMQWHTNSDSALNARVEWAYIS